MERKYVINPGFISLTCGLNINGVHCYLSGFTYFDILINVAAFNLQSLVVCFKMFM